MNTFSLIVEAAAVSGKQVTRRRLEQETENGSEGGIDLNGSPSKGRVTGDMSERSIDLPFVIMHGTAVTVCTNGDTPKWGEWHAHNDIF